MYPFCSQIKENILKLIQTPLFYSLTAQKDFGQLKKQMQNTKLGN